MQAIEALGRIADVFERDNRQKDRGGSDLAAALLARMRQVRSLPVLNEGAVLPQAREGGHVEPCSPLQNN